MEIHKNAMKMKNRHISPSIAKKIIKSSLLHPEARSNMNLRSDFVRNNEFHKKSFLYRFVTRDEKWKFHFAQILESYQLTFAVVV